MHGRPQHLIRHDISTVATYPVRHPTLVPASHYHPLLSCRKDRKTDARPDATTSNGNTTQPNKKEVDEEPLRTSMVALFETLILHIESVYIPEKASSNALNDEWNTAIIQEFIYIG